MIDHTRRCLQRRTSPRFQSQHDFDCELIEIAAALRLAFQTVERAKMYFLAGGLRWPIAYRTKIEMIVCASKISNESRSFYGIVEAYQSYKTEAPKGCEPAEEA
jgi:hypothetical protein